MACQWLDTPFTILLKININNFLILFILMNLRTLIERVIIEILLFLESIEMYFYNRIYSKRLSVLNNVSQNTVKTK